MLTSRWLSTLQGTVPSPRTAQPGSALHQRRAQRNDGGERGRVGRLMAWWLAVGWQSLTEARVAGCGGSESGCGGEVVDREDGQVVRLPRLSADEGAAVVDERLRSAEEGVDDRLQALVDGLRASIE